MSISGRERTHSPALKSRVRGALEGVLLSAPFHSSKQLQMLLRHVVEKTLDGQEDRLKERMIGADVFGRPADYNTGDDPIVRLRVSDLRKRLAQYYQSDESREATLKITIPPGSYSVHFQDCIAASAHDDAAEATESNLDQRLAAASPKPTQPRSLPLTWVAAVCVAGLVLGILGTFAAVDIHSAQSGVSDPATIANPILRRIFSPNTVVNVVLPDANLATLLKVVNRASISVDDYEDPRYPDFLLAEITDPALRDVLSRNIRNRYTPLGAANIAIQSMHWGTIAGSTIAVRYARFMHVQDFEHGNFVLVGDRISNPWISLFEPTLNFYQERDTGGIRFHFRNRNPRPGESQTYGILDKGGESYVGYVDIAILPNLSENGSVLLMSGLWGDMCVAAADLIFRKDLPPAVSHALESHSNTSTTEILLRVQYLKGAQWGSEIVSIRTGAPDS